MKRFVLLLMILLSVGLVSGALGDPTKFGNGTSVTVTIGGTDGIGNFSGNVTSDVDVCITGGNCLSSVTTSPAGSDTYVQFNDGGSFGGSENFTFNKSTQSLLLPTGTASNPSWSFVSDPDSGIYSLGGNQMKIVAGGSSVVDIATTLFDFYGDNFRVGRYVAHRTDTDTNIDFNAADTIVLTAGGSAVLTLADDVGDEAVLINNPSATNIGLTIQGASAQSANLQEWQDSAGTVVSSIGPSGRVFIPAGTGANPGLAYISDVDTGITSGTGYMTLAADASDAYIQVDSTGANAQVEFGAGTRKVAQFEETLGGTENIALQAADDSISHQVTFTTSSGQVANITIWENSTGGVNLYVPPSADDICLADGTCLSTVSGGSTSPGGSDTYIQFNDGGSFGGSANLTWNGTVLNITGEAHGIGCIDYDADGSCEIDSDGSNIEISPNDDGTTSWDIGIAYIAAGPSTTYPRLHRRGISLTTPFTTRGDDTNTGVGLDGSDKGSLIAGGNNVLTFADDVGDESVLINNPSAANIGLTVQGAAAQSANLQEWQDSAGTVLVSVQADGDFVPSGTGSESIKVGSGTTASQTRSLAIGAGATASGGQHVMAIGSYSQATLTQATAVGYDARATATDALAIGYATRADQNDCIALGKGADCTKTNQLVLGSTSIDADKLTEIYWPNNDVSLQFNESGVNFKINATINVTGGEDVCLEDGTCLSTAGGGSPGGSDTQIQFNEGGSFGGSENFTWNGTMLNVTGLGRYATNLADIATNNPSFAWDVDYDGVNEINFDAGGRIIFDLDGDGDITNDVGDFCLGTLCHNVGAQYYVSGAYARIAIYRADTAYQFNSDTDTQIVTVGADQMGLQAGGSNVLILSDDVGDESVLINNPSAANIGLTVQGAAAQSANLQEWQDSAGTILTRINSAGDLVIGGETAGRDYDVVFNKGASTESDILFQAGGTNYAFIRGSTTEQLTIGTTGGNRLLIDSDEILLLDATTDVRIRPGSNNVAVFDDGGSDEAVLITPVVAADIGLTVKGATSQSANLQEWQNSSNTVLASVNASGSIEVASTEDVCISGGNCLSTVSEGTAPLNVRTITANYTISADDRVIVFNTSGASEDIYVTLPSANDNIGRELEFYAVGDSISPFINTTGADRYLYQNGVHDTIELLFGGSAVKLVSIGDNLWAETAIPQLSYVSYS